MDWQEDAACRKYDNVVFFGPDQGESELEKQAREMKAKSICHTCPVKEPCLESRWRRIRSTASGVG